MTTKQVGEAKAEAFAGHVVDILNGGTLFVDAGHRPQDGALRHHG